MSQISTDLQQNKLICYSNFHYNSIESHPSSATGSADGSAASVVVVVATGEVDLAVEDAVAAAAAACEAATAAGLGAAVDTSLRRKKRVYVTSVQGWTWFGLTYRADT